MELIEDHENLDRLAEELIALAHAPQKPAPSRGYVMLRNFERQLNAHLADEAEFVYCDHMRATVLDQEIEKFESSFEDLKVRWKSYLAEWSEQRIDGDWNGFVNATSDIMWGMRERIAAENAVLYPLALQYSRIRLRAA